MPSKRSGTHARSDARPWPVLLLVVVLGCAPNAARPGPQSPLNEAKRQRLRIETHDQATSLYLRGDFEKAALAYSQAIRLDPDNPKLYADRGDAHAELFALQRAIADYSMALSLIERSPGALDASRLHTERGNAYAYLGDFENALADFNKAIRIDPASSYAYGQRGYLHQECNRFDQAIEDYTRSILFGELDTDGLPGILTQRGALYRKLGRFDVAFQDFERALRLRPGYVVAYKRQGDAYADLQQLEKALQCYNRAIAGNPDYAAAYLARARVHQQLDDPMRAERDLLRARQLDPDVENQSLWRK